MFIIKQSFNKNLCSRFFSNYVGKVKEEKLIESNIVFTPFFHSFHLVNPSPWPLLCAVNLLLIMLSVVALLHYPNYIFGVNLKELIFGLGGLLLTLFCWWRDVIRESTFEEKHTPVVRQGLLLGMILFIISEIFLFFGFFWAFFHSSLVPSSAIGGVWPPIFIEVINPFALPLVNTLALILSGCTLTISHYQLKYLPFYDTSVRLFRLQRLVFWLGVTVFLGVFFLFCQAFEYYYATFTIQDTIYGTTFYSLTGLHGFHVMVGTIFLIVCFFRAIQLHFYRWKQVGLKSAIWYWHFVDVVWIILFLVVYIWGGGLV